MELFEVFIKIAINAEEINRKLNEMARNLEKFVDACDEMAEKCNNAFGSMYDSFMKWATRLGAVNTYIKFFENMGSAIESLTTKGGKLNTALQSLGGYVTTAYNGLTKFGESAKETGLEIYSYLNTKLTEAITWLTKFGEKVVESGAKLGKYLGDKLVLVGKKIAAFGVKVKASAGKLLLLLGPKGLIIAAIAAVVIAVIGWIKNSEEAQERLREIWEKVKEAIEPVINFIRNLIDTVFTWIGDFIKERCEYMYAVFRGVLDLIKGRFEFIIENIKSVFRIFSAIFRGDWQEAWDEVLAIGNRIMQRIEDVFEGIKDIGKNLIRGLWNGIQSMGYWISSKITGFFSNGVLGSVTRFLGINSPSKLFADKVGKSIVKGVAEGIEEEAYTAEEAAIAMAKDMLDPQAEMFELSFMEISEIVVRALEQMSRKAIQIIRTMTATMDAILNHDGFRIGRNFFRALGDGLIAEEAALLSRASWVADAIRREFGSLDGNPGLAAVNAAQSWANHHPQFMDMASMPMAAQNVNVTQNFYGVREKETAYQAYRAAQRVAWGVERSFMRLYVYDSVSYI